MPCSLCKYCKYHYYKASERPCLLCSHYSHRADFFTLCKKDSKKTKEFFKDEDW